MNPNRTAVAYVRVSTELQASEGVSLEAQTAKARAWAEASDYQLAAVHTETMSGGRADNRPELQAAIASACKAKAPLVVYSLSRLARSTSDALEIVSRLHRAGADLVSLSERIDTTSAAGRMMLTMLAAFAEFERGQIRERTAAAMSHLRGQGRRISRLIPYGYQLAQDGTTLLEVPEEMAVISEIRALRAEGISYSEIARELAHRGTPTRTGAPWSHTVIRGIFLRSEKVTPRAPVALAA